MFCNIFLFLVEELNTMDSKSMTSPTPTLLFMSRNWMTGIYQSCCIEMHSAQVTFSFSKKNYLDQSLCHKIIESKLHIRLFHTNSHPDSSISQCHLVEMQRIVIVAILDLLVLYEVVMTWCHGWWRCPGAKERVPYKKVSWWRHIFLLSV